jgi:Na+/H+-dicarboxylate symporter
MSSNVSPSLISRWFNTPLWKRILLALVLGAIVGVIWGEGAQSIRWIGDLFIRAIQMVVVPLVFITIVAGVVSMGDPKRLGSLGIKTLSLYMVTTLIAITIGLTLAALIQPGVGVDMSAAVPGTLQQPISFRDQLMRIVPTNPIAALASGDFLAIIFFAILFGAGIISVGASGKPMADLMDSGAAIMLKLTGWVMEVAPFGVFALIAWVSGTQGVAALMDVIPLAGTATLAFILHFVLIYGAMMKFLVGLSPYKFFRNIKNAFLVAFSTSSSSATLPVTISVAEKNLGIKPVIASTVLPLGATINMDGSAIYVGVVSVFAAQAFGVDLTLVDYFIMAGATTLVSIGTAAVPGASVFLMAGVMATIGLTPEQIALVVGFVLPFDRPLDMMRTTLNVTGDLTCATVVAKWEGEFDEKIFNRNNEEVNGDR